VSTTNGSEATKWKRTERHPEFADHCKRICERYGVEYPSFDVVRDAIEESLENDPVTGSVAVSEDVPELRRFVFEPLPQHWNLPALIVVYIVDEVERSFTLSAVWTEEELEEQA
jgi:hypothetical protein